MKNYFEFITSHFFWKLFFFQSLLLLCLHSAWAVDVTWEKKAPFFPPLLWYTVVILSVVERKQMPHKGAINSFLIHCLWSAFANGTNKDILSKIHSVIHLILFIWCCELCPKIIHRHYFDLNFVVGDSIFLHHLIVKFWNKKQWARPKDKWRKLSSSSWMRRKQTRNLWTEYYDIFNEHGWMNKFTKYIQNNERQDGWMKMFGVSLRIKDWLICCFIIYNEVKWF